MLLLHYLAVVGLGERLRYVRYVDTSVSAVSLRRTGTPLRISHPSFTSYHTCMSVALLKDDLIHYDYLFIQLMNNCWTKFWPIMFWQC